MSEGLLGLIGVAVGAGLTFAFTMLSNWQANRAERKRIRNQVLYYLFEVHHRLSKLQTGLPDFQTIWKKYLEARKDRLSENFNPEKEEWPTIYEIIEIGIHQLTLKELLALQPNYSLAIQELAKIAPVSAYYLHDLPSRLEKMEELMDLWGDQVRKHDPNVEKSELIAIWKTGTKPAFVNRDMNLIEETALQMTGRWRWKKDRKSAAEIFTLNRTQDIDAIEREVFECLDRIFKKKGLLKAQTITLEIDDADWSEILKLVTQFSDPDDANSIAKAYEEE